MNIKGKILLSLFLLIFIFVGIINTHTHFENKEKFLANEKQNKQKENVRYWITTGLSIGALVVSIIALIVSFCK